MSLNYLPATPRLVMLEKQVRRATPSQETKDLALVALSIAADGEGVDVLQEAVFILCSECQVPYFEAVKAIRESVTRHFYL